MKTLLFSESYLIASLTLFTLLVSILLKQKIILFITTIIFLFLMFFFRVPNRTLSLEINKNDYIISPCDGTILKIEEEGNQIKIITFLSIFNVHVQWYPIDGYIKRLEHKNGEFNMANILEKSEYNEKFITEIENDKGIVKLDQVAGQIACRIVNKSVLNDYVKSGDYMGMIKFSSRVNIYLPKDKVELLVKENDKIFGKETLIAKWII
jgi:phosphatidylserine decarboxylase